MQRVVTLVDDAGDTVRLAAPARRIVSLNPVVTELLFSVGAGERLAGRTSTCDYPPAAARIPSVGDWLPPNIEVVVARAPDLVILYQSPVTAPAVARLRRLGIPAVAFRTDRLGDVSRLARALAPALGAGPAAARFAATHDSALAALRRTARRDPARTVALVAWNSPLTVLGAGSFLSEIIELAGAANAFGDIPFASAPVSLEALLARAPALVLVTIGGGGAPGHTRTLHLTDPALERPGPRVPAAVARLRRLLDSALAPVPHPETRR